MEELGEKWIMGEEKYAPMKYYWELDNSDRLDSYGDEILGTMIKNGMCFGIFL